MCDQSLTADVTPVLTSEGKEIKVHIKLNRVCLAKHVVVGVELHEVIGTNPRLTARRALKVIHLMPSGEGCSERECNCATFYIPPKDNASTDPTCDGQTFIIKAKAHHYSCREVIVGVRVYVGGQLYAMKTKKIFTGGRRYCRKIDQIYVDCFEFLFIDACQDDICVNMLAHYIQ